MVCTTGSSGSNDEDMTSDRIVEIRRKEQEEAAAVIGVKNLVMLPPPPPPPPRTAIWRRTGSFWARW